MSNNSAKQLSFRISFCAIISAISVIFMFGALIPSLAYAVPAVAGILLWTICEQVNIKWAFLSYIAVVLLSFMLIPEIEANCFLLSFFGYYPTLCELLKRIKNKILRYVVKLIVFNISVVITYNVLCIILSADKMLEGMESFGKYAVYVLWGAGLVAFILYDLFLDVAKDLYIKIIKPKLNKLTKK